MNLIYQCKVFIIDLTIILFKKNKDILAAFSKLDGIVACSRVFYEQSTHDEAAFTGLSTPELTPVIRERRR